MSYGSHLSKVFVEQLADKSVRDVFVADQIRSRIALMIRALREQPDRNWTQAQLGEHAGKKQNVISRIEDPDYGRITLQSLFDVAAALDVPVWIDMPEWSEWLANIRDVPNTEFVRKGFDVDAIMASTRPEPRPAAPGSATASAIRSMRRRQTMPQGSAATNANQALTEVGAAYHQQDRAITFADTQDRNGAYRFVASSMQSEAA